MVMRAMRANAKWLMLILAVAFVGWMIFDVGLNIQGQSGSTTDAALRVNGERVSYQDFLFAVRAASERQRSATGSGPVTLEEQRRLEDQVVEQIISDIVLSEEYRRRGITVTDAEIRQAAQTSPPQEIIQAAQFQTDGQFDLEKYRRYLAAGADPNFLIALENRYRSEIPRIKLYEQLTADVYVSDAELWRQYQAEHDTVVAELLTLRPQAAVADSMVALTDQELNAYYRANRRDFERPAQAFMSYVRIPKIPNAADSVAALELARELRQEIVDSISTFEDVARRESADSASRFRGGGFGLIQPGVFNPTFEQAAKSLRVGEISEPVETPFGYHIIRLDSISGESYSPSHVLVAFEVRGAHLDSVESMADSLDLFGAEQDDPAALDRVADMVGATVQQAPRVFEGDFVRVGSVRVPDAGVWAFETTEGETSQVIEAQDGYYLFRLDSLVDEGVPPLEDIRATVEREALREKKVEASESIVDRVNARVQEGVDFETIQGEFTGVANSEMPPFSRANPAFQLANVPEALGWAFGLEAGEVSPPIRPQGSDFVHWIRTISRTQADTSAFVAQIEEQRQQAVFRKRDARVRGYLLALREGANVIDRRREIEAVQRELADQQDGLGLPGPLGF